MKQSIILLHGLFGRLSNWNALVQHLNHAHDVHVPLIPIYDDHNGSILDYLVNWLHLYITCNKLKTVVLVGNSLGGHLAVLYTHRYPSIVKALVLTGSSGLYERNAFGTFPKRHSRTFIQSKVESVFYNPAIATSELVDEVFYILKDNKKCLRIIETARTTQRNYAIKELQDIKQQALLIWGADDNITPPHVAIEFNRLLVNASLVYLPQCGHAPMMEKPGEFNKLVEDFLATLQP
ncbi:alpha/beta fold hydrolase [Desertivirga arenae]|uniref:alpha/beta fold hydrolase n=1 Tax=Desertivirga arenae TaxID=2810309 RepID=UPI001F617CEC|nr:alpha/beta hydrolase [Pedobacter sp. SYSU D00823]